jgi:hypothetical protein
MNKLGTQRSLGGPLQPQEEKGDFFAKKKEQFLQMEQKKGYDFFAMQDWLERHKLLSLDSYIMEQNMMNPAYVNTLATFQAKPSMA